MKSEDSIDPNDWTKIAFRSEMSFEQLSYMWAHICAYKKKKNQRADK